MPFWNNVSGTWKAVAAKLNVSGTWKDTIPYINVSGTWKVLGNLFHPVGGSYNDSQVDVAASFTITCDVSAVWTWSRVGATQGTCDVPSGGSATIINFFLAPPLATGNRTSIFTVQGNAGGQIENYTITLSADKT